MIGEKNGQSVAAGAVAAFIRSRDAFLESLHPRLPRPMILATAAVVAAVFALLAAFAPQGLASGDAAVYSQQISTLNLADRAVHIGYFLLGIAFTRLAPLPVDFALNLLNCLLGALCAGLAVTLAWTLTGRRAPALAAALILVCNALFITNSCFADNYTPQLFFIMLATQLVLWNRPATAGAAFAGALLVTPSSIFAVPMLAALRPRWRPVLAGGAVAAAIAGAVLAPHLHTFFYGYRGLASTFGVKLGLIPSVLKETRELAFFSFFAFFIAAGALAMLADPRRRLFVAALALLWLATFKLGEKFDDVPVQIPLYGLLAVVGGVGFGELFGWARRSPALRAAAWACLALGVAVSGGKSLHDAWTVRHDTQAGRATALAAPLAPGDVFVGDWDQGTLFSHYRFRKSYLAEWINTENLAGGYGGGKRAETLARLTRALDQGAKVFLLGDPAEKRPEFVKVAAEIRALLKHRNYKIAPFREIEIATPPPPPNPKAN